MPFPDNSGAAARLLESLVDIAARRAGIEEATLVAASLPTRTVGVLEEARRMAMELEVADDHRSEIRRLLDLLGGTGLFRR